MRRRLLSPILGALLRLALCAGAMLGAAIFAGLDVAHDRLMQRGVESGLSADQPALQSPRYGVNVALEAYPDANAAREALLQIRDAGFGLVRQRFAWAEAEPHAGQYHWGQWDDLLPLAQAAGLQVIAVLDTSPDWARRDWEADNPYAPPAELDNFARYAGAFAARYGRWIAAYQVWDQPNIAPHWGNGEINPAGYVAMLRTASAAIRTADPDALIIAGALAPNVEAGGRNLSDVQYLHEIYRRGAGAYFDILGVCAYGFWSGPEDRRVDQDVLNFSRVILLREEMRRRGEANKPIWAVDGGWCALPADWRGQPAPQGSDSLLVQSERLERAMQRIEREWPWMGAAILAQWRPNADLDNPVWGYSLVEPDGAPKAVLGRLRERLTAAPILYPGRTVNPSAAWRPTQNPNLTDFVYWGTDLTLDVAPGVAAGELAVTADTIHTDVLIPLAADAKRPDRVRIGGRAALGEHQARLRGAPEQLAAIRAVQVGARPSQSQVWGSLLAGALVWVWCGLAAWRASRRIPWRTAWATARAFWLRAPSWAQISALALAWVGALATPHPYARLGCAALAGIFSLPRLDLALYAAIFAIPWAPLHVRLGPGSFSLAEIATLIAVGAWSWNALFDYRGRDESAAARRLSLTLADGLVIALAALGLATCFLAEYQKVAFREWRVMVIGPGLLYLLIRAHVGARYIAPDEGMLPTARARYTAPLRYATPLRLADALWVSLVGVALYALVAYVSGAGIIAAEGVRRARAFYGSPNNLALVMERALPLGLAAAIWARSRGRRWLYALGCAPVALALLLTYSRGALLVGVPAALATLALISGKRARWAVLALAAVGALALIPALGSERFRSLFDLSQGTSFLRVSLWQAAWDMVRDHPILGVGLDNFLYYYGDYIRPGAEVDRWLSHPHNVLLDFWLRLGIGGLALIAALLASYARRALRAVRTLDGDARAIAIGLMAAMAGALAHGCIDSFFFVTELAYWFMFALAWMYAMTRARL